MLDILTFAKENTLRLVALIRRRTVVIACKDPDGGRRKAVPFEILALCNTFLRRSISLALSGFYLLFEGARSRNFRQFQH